MAHNNSLVLMLGDKAGLGVVTPVDGLTLLHRMLEGSGASHLAEVSSMRPFPQVMVMTFCLSWSHMTSRCMQPIATPFLFGRMLRGLESVPRVFLHMAAATSWPEALAIEAVDTRQHKRIDVAGDSLGLAHGFDDIITNVRSRVHAILGPEVRFSQMQWCMAGLMHMSPVHKASC